MLRPLMPEEAISYLLEHALIERRSIVSGSLSIRDVSRRNRSLIVDTHDERSLFLKQAVNSYDAECLSREATLYSYLHRHRSGFNTHLVELIHYDERRRILVLGLVRDAITISAIHAHARYSARSVGSAFGRALAKLHEIVPDEAALPALRTARPWVLDAVHPTYSEYIAQSAATRELARMIQARPNISKRFSVLSQAWAGDSVIHLDVKGGNVIKPKGQPINRCLKLIDWEFGGIGDPRWDVGSVFADYLLCWLLSFPAGGPVPLADLIPIARRPLPELQGEIRAFWAIYAKLRKLDLRHSRTFLKGAIAYTAARLLQTAIELAQQRDSLNSLIFYLLQLALNFIELPFESALILIGLDSAAMESQGGE